MTAINRPAGATAVAAALIVVAVAGCGGQSPFTAGMDLPAESPEIADSAWPRLADAPALAQIDGPGGLEEDLARGAAIDASISAEVLALQARAAQLRARPVLDDDLSDDAAILRRRAARLGR